MCDELPETVEVRHGDRGYRVVPLVELELTDPHAAGLLRRYRSRAHIAPTDQAPDDPAEAGPVRPRPEPAEP